MPAGVYLHIPFCKSRCSYCDFATDVFKNEETVERYVNALVKEISKFKIQNLKFKIEVDTIYFGGGTPSLLKPEQLEKILDALHKKFSISFVSAFTYLSTVSSVLKTSVAKSQYEQRERQNGM